jgi:NADPH:quinone reductase-like Zn-dependent oxidoreductase
VTSLGADDVIDHTVTDLPNSAGRYGVVLDTFGNLTIDSKRRLLAPGGRLLLPVATSARRCAPAGTWQPETHGSLPRTWRTCCGWSTTPAARRARLGRRPRRHRDVHRRVDSGRKVGNAIVCP